MEKTEFCFSYRSLLFRCSEKSCLCPWFSGVSSSPLGPASAGVGPLWFVHFPTSLHRALPCSAAVVCVFQVAKRGKVGEMVERKGGEGKPDFCTVPLPSWNCFSRLVSQVALFAPSLVSALVKRKKNKNRYQKKKRHEGRGNLSVPTSNSLGDLLLTIPRVPAPVPYLAPSARKHGCFSPLQSGTHSV